LIYITFFRVENEQLYLPDRGYLDSAYGTYGLPAGGNVGLTIAGQVRSMMMVVMMTMMMMMIVTTYSRTGDPRTVDRR
jgi:hypothetical protein